LKSEIWDVIARDYKHMFYTSTGYKMDVVLYFASYNGLTMNDIYLARQNVSSVEDHKENTWEMLNNGFADGDTVYIFNSIPEHLIINNTLAVYVADDMIIGVAAEIENTKYMRGVEQIILSEGSSP